jgi:hypothetical protein
VAVEGNVREGGLSRGVEGDPLAQVLANLEDLVQRLVPVGPKRRSVHRLNEQGARLLECAASRYTKSAHGRLCRQEIRRLVLLDLCIRGMLAKNKTEGFRRPTSFRKQPSGSLIIKGTGWNQSNLTEPRCPLIRRPGSTSDTRFPVRKILCVFVSRIMCHLAPGRPRTSRSRGSSGGLCRSSCRGCS